LAPPPGGIIQKLFPSGEIIFELFPLEEELKNYATFFPPWKEGNISSSAIILLQKRSLEAAEKPRPRPNGLKIQVFTRDDSSKFWHDGHLRLLILGPSLRLGFQ